MIKYSVGDVVTVKERHTNKEVDAVITKVDFKYGYIMYFIRRKDNKAFKTDEGYKYNIWVKGEKAEVSRNDKTINN
jgi:hypothetical protein